MSVKHGKSLVKMSGNPVHKSEIKVLVLKIIHRAFIPICHLRVLNIYEAVMLYCCHSGWSIYCRPMLQ